MKRFSTVRVSRGIGVAAVLASIVVAGSAVAADSKKVTQKGTVEGDSGASVRLAVISQGGELKSVKGIRFKELLTDCRSGAERIELDLLGAATVNPDNRRFENSYGAKGTDIIDLRGRVSKSGKRVRGEITGTEVEIRGAGTCEVPDVEFVTKR